MRVRAQPGPQTQFLTTPADVAVFGGAAGSGKRLDVSTQIPTPTGWTTMGELKAGDQVFDGNGDICRVTVAWPIEVSDNSWDVVFDDGQVVRADGEHLWVTSTQKDRIREYKQTAEFREKRKRTRPKRAKCTATLRSKLLSERNSASARLRVLAPYKGVRTTDEIRCTLTDHRGRRVHSVKVSGINTPESELLIDPYILGCWLGDGSSHCGQITSMDPEIHGSFAAIYTPGPTQNKPGNKAWSITYKGLSASLKHLDLIHNKHIPQQYLRSSHQQRLALLQGLMDTDGTSSTDGRTSFTTTNPKLKDGFLELIWSLGIKAASCEGRAKLYGKDCGPVWDIHFTSTEAVFRLQRKLSRTAPKPVPRVSQCRVRYITDIIPAPAVEMRCIAVDSPDHTYLCGRAMIPTHNSYAELLDSLRWIKYDGYRSVIFRKTLQDIKKAGSLLDSARELFTLVPGLEARESPIDFRWPKYGSHIQLAGLEGASDHFLWKGAQLWTVYFDELTEHRENQFHYMRTRIRGSRRIRGYTRATTNPDPRSWVKPYLGWWIDTDGYAIQERSGVLRWIARDHNDKLQNFGSEREALQYLKSIDDHTQRPYSLTFIPAKLSDNPALTERDPQYAATLSQQDRQTRHALADGCWNYKGGGGMFFDRKWLEPWNQEINPRDIKLSVRGWDLAYSDGKKSDWSCGVLIHMMKDGRLIIADVQRFQYGPGALERRIIEIIRADGHRVVQCFWQDPAAGKLAAEQLKQQIGREVPGIRVEVEPAAKSKVDYFKPFSAAIDRDSKPATVCFFKPSTEWNAKYFDELEQFTGDPKLKDDHVDATSRAWIHIAKHGFRVGLAGWTNDLM